MENREIGRLLSETADLMEIAAEDPFRIRSYRNGASAIESLPERIEDIAKEGKLTGIPGIGKGLASAIDEILKRGSFERRDLLLTKYPPTALELLKIQGLGPKTIALLWEHYRVSTIDDLERICQEQKLRLLPRLGAKLEEKVLRSIAQYRRSSGRFLLSFADELASELVTYLEATPGVDKVTPAGSLRRGKETLGDLDLLVTGPAPEAALDRFVAYPRVGEVLGKGPNKASAKVGLQSIQVDVRALAADSYGAALMYFTGSKEHNIVMRQRAIDRGLRLNEYGLFHSKVETRDPKLLVKCRTEEEMFEKLGLHYIPPEMREDMGEFALAEKGPLPRLIEWTDLKGSLHNHSTWSDGHQRPEEIAKAMCELGLAYWGITDHSKSSFQANGLDAARVRQQLKEIASINATLAKEGSDFRLLIGTEVDILKDGKLDFPDDLLAELDVVIASIHQSFNQTEAETTKRLIGAAQNPYVHILGHLTGRLLLEREPYKVDHRAVIDACAETGTWIELNAHPMRFDMDWRWWPYAKSKGVKCAINCDAHRFEHAGFLRLGAGIARKGWLTKEDVVNTLPLKALLKELGKKRAKACC
jgi:DNA polymerase (family 10)